MSRWWEKLRGRPLYPLLEEDDPSVRYFTLTRVLGRPASAPAVQTARAAIAHGAFVRAVRRSLQLPDHQLVEPRYRALLWKVSLLASLGVAGRDEEIAAACDRLLDAATRPAGDFLDARGGLRTEAVSPSAILVRAVARLGFPHDERNRFLVERLLALPLHLTGVPCTRHSAAPCPDCAVLVLAAIAALPPSKRGDEISLWTSSVADWLLAQDIMEMPPHWRQFTFPVFDWPGLLFAARTLLDCGYAGDARMTPWGTFIVQAQNEQGGWPVHRQVTTAGDKPTVTKVHAEKWVTWQALQVMRVMYGD